MTHDRAAAPRALWGVVAAAGLLAAEFLSTGSRAAAPVVHTIVIEAMRFEPRSLEVHAGDRVIWINRDPFPHTVVSEVGRFRSGEIAAGQSWQIAVTRTGVLPYACSLHPTMEAELRVD